jgi:hypothetical protein
MREHLKCASSLVVKKMEEIREKKVLENKDGRKREKEK